MSNRLHSLPRIRRHWPRAWLARLLLCGCLCAASLPALAAETEIEAGHETTYEPSDAGSRLTSTQNVVAAFVALSLLFCLLLYLVPSRAIAANKRRLEETVRERVLTLQEEDRRRIARDLHDGAGQALTAARLQLMALRGAELTAGSIDPIIQCIDEAMDEVRRSTTSLSPPVLAELGLGPAIVRHCEAFSMGSGLVVRCEVPERLPELEAHVEIACYRIVQEGLHNAARHAGATQAWVRLTAGDLLRLEIGDNGAGMAGAGEGFGLSSIRQRAALLGGEISVLEGTGPGSRLLFSLPLGRRRG